jgi:hypothetical protein
MITEQEPDPEPGHLGKESQERKYRKDRENSGKKGLTVGALFSADLTDKT